MTRTANFGGNRRVRIWGSVAPGLNGSCKMNEDQRYKQRPRNEYNFQQYGIRPCRAASLCPASAKLRLTPWAQSHDRPSKVSSRPYLFEDGQDSEPRLLMIPDVQRILELGKNLKRIHGWLKLSELSRRAIHKPNDSEFMAICKVKAQPHCPHVIYSNSNIKHTRRMSPLLSNYVTVISAESQPQSSLHFSNQTLYLKAPMRIIITG